ncbi:hypothetical protein GYMLUDRAFT_63315 [Collybiopsis luxurians FD-317 M1]|uniref:F-box domain-containing protein n=1 Tax=Collybiopsis luxurians FD-317 M1 TaxID=944289 RepID=A0A0D0C883_9AGAR|nr:hypothetical protein GYMLUDRAFT_63315 [Collybiopsis luxurians FD-317 M1]
MPPLVSGNNTGPLAFELLQRVASESSSIHEIALLSRVCKYFNATFNDHLYKSPSVSALPTLAQSIADRFPLETPHPASFVRNLTVGPKSTSEMVIAALKNIEVSGKPLMGLFISSSTFSLADVMRYPLPEFLGSLHCLRLRTPYPRMPQGRALEIARSLCASSLTVCKLAFNTKTSPGNYLVIVDLLRALVLTNLTYFNLHIPEPSFVDDHEHVLAELLDNPTFRFESLTSLTLLVDIDMISFDKFFRQHLGLTELRFTGSPRLCDVTDLSSNEVLMDLRAFHGGLDDLIALSRRPGCRLQAVTVTDISVSWARNTMHQVLANLPNLRHLAVQDASDNLAGYTTVTLVDMKRSCPDLELIDLILNTQALGRIGLVIELLSPQHLSSFILRLINGFQNLSRAIMRVSAEQLPSVKNAIDGAMEKAIPFFGHIDRQIVFELRVVDTFMPERTSRVIDLAIEPF